MNKTYIYIALSLLGSMVFCACSIKKNTWFTRQYEALNTKYNVYFNGRTSYEEGLKSISDAHQDDYANLLHMYPISRHENAGVAVSNMNQTIEKCRKAIKLHSIKQKPNRDLKKWTDPKYQLWYNQEEFNKELKNVWLLLAKAEFHKADFIGSVGTFSYIAKHYSADKDLVAQCQLWMVRAYQEMGWLYEAEEMLSKVNQDDLKYKNMSLYASVRAEVHLKKKEYSEAIPYLEFALQKENNRYFRQRFGYLLAQLYQRTGQASKSYSAFRKVIQMNPSFEMDFNARINNAQLNTQNPLAVRKELLRMLKNANFKDYQDQIYFSIGKSFLVEKDTVRAIDNFKLSVKNSVRNGYDKALTLITLGDLYFEKKNYIESEPCYAEAAKIISVDNSEYERVSKRAEALSGLVVEYQVIFTQDSLQRLGRMSDLDRREKIKQIIEKVKEDEKIALEKKQEEQEIQASQNEEEELMPLINPSVSKDWYFYNPSVMKVGQVEFTKKWGKRKLEDNWRRLNKSVAVFSDKNMSSEIQEVTADSVPKNTAGDNKTVEFYLQQIPQTTSQFEKSDDAIANAMFAMGVIYMEKINDPLLALETFERLKQRFAMHPKIIESYFRSYLIANKMNNVEGKEYFRNKIIQEFPNSRYAELLKDSDFSSRTRKMYQEQDSLYQCVYDAFKQNNFQKVKELTIKMQELYPTSDLMPKFKLLESLSICKTQSSLDFEKSINDLIIKYPDSEIASYAKGIVALMKQGKEPSRGTMYGGLLNQRAEENKSLSVEVVEKKKEFVLEKEGRHRILLMLNNQNADKNKLIYNVAVYNFTQFIVKELDVQLIKIEDKDLLMISNFDGVAEARWYLNAIERESVLSQLMKEMNVKEIIISEQNYGLLRSYFTMEDYLKFYNNKINK